MKKLKRPRTMLVLVRIAPAMFQKMALDTVAIALEVTKEILISLMDAKVW